jgi:hypothetical protein
MWYGAMGMCWIAICYNTSVDGTTWASDTIHNQVFQGEICKSPSNPVVIYDKDESCYKMWYNPCGGDMIGYAISEVLTTKEKKPSPAEQVCVFPKPVVNTLQIVSDSKWINSVEIHTLNGQLISTFCTEGSTFQLDLSSFQNGTYFITIRSKEFVTTKKIIKL